jgi:hypothetical protein
VSKWTYFALLAVAVVSFAVAEASILSAGWTVLLITVLLLLALGWRRYINVSTSEQAFRRSYAVSEAAAYSALCGALLDLGYVITTRNLSAGTLQFRGGRLGPWIGRFGTECKASVRGLGDRESEIVIVGRVSTADRHGWGVLIYPEPLDSRIETILDRVQATAGISAVLDAG